MISQFDVTMDPVTPVFMQILAPPGPLWWVKRIILASTGAPNTTSVRAGVGGGTGGWLLSWRVGGAPVVPTQFDFDDHALSATEGLWLFASNVNAHFVGTIEYITGLSS